MSATINWSTFANSDAASFNIYRAITGFVIPFPNSLASGDSLALAAMSSLQQLVRFTAVDIDSIVAAINSQAKGVKAIKNQAGTGVFVRCIAVDDPKLKVLPCTAATKLSLAAGPIGPRGSFQQIGSVAAVLGQTAYSFADPDGDATDFYHITSVSAGVESIPSQDLQPVITPASVCVIEGRITDAQNNPVVGACVKASVEIPVGISDNTGLSKKPVQVLTDYLGRWSLYFVQNQLVLFQIEAIGYNQVIRVPQASFILFEDLKPVDTAYFDVDPQPGEL